LEIAMEEEEGAYAQLKLVTEAFAAESVFRNNSRHGCCGVERQQPLADSGMMSACCSWRERSSESSRMS
jgi:hypothetical protein